MVLIHTVYLFFLGQIIDIKLLQVILVRYCFAYKIEEKIVCQLVSACVCVRGILNNLESENKKNGKKRIKQESGLSYSFVVFIFLRAITLRVLIFESCSLLPNCSHTYKFVTFFFLTTHFRHRLFTL